MNTILIVLKQRFVLIMNSLSNSKKFISMNICLQEETLIFSVDNTMNLMRTLQKCIPEQSEA